MLSSNNIKLWPFSKVDDEWTLNDEALFFLYEKIKSQGLDKVVFYDGSVNNWMEFIAMMKSKEVTPVIAYDDTGVLGMAWLTAGHNEWAFGHFCMLKESWGKKSLKIGKVIMRYWFSLKLNDKNIFKTIIGITPPKNEKALKYIQKIGFNLLGEIPNVGVISFANKFGDS